MSGVNSLFQAPLSVQVSLISLGFVVCAPVVICIPLAILFKEPIIMCTDPITKIQFECAEDMACGCSSNFLYKIQKEEGPYSFSTQFELICDNTSLKRLALTFLFIGYLLAAILQTLFVINKKWYRIFMILGSFGLAVSFSLMLLVGLFDLEFTFIVWILFSAGLFLIYTNTYSFIYVSQVFSSELASLYMVFASILSASMGIFYTALGYFFNADWRIMIGVGALIIFAATTVFCFTKLDPIVKNEKEEENMNIISYFQQLWRNSTIRNNFLIYTLTWSVCCLCYSVIYVEMESVGGSVYFNTTLCCCLEIFCAVFTSFLHQRYKSASILNIATLTIFASFMVFFLAPCSIAEASGSLIFLLVTCLLIAKLCTDLVNLLVYLTLAPMFTSKYIGLYVIISRALARILTVFMPTVNFLIENIGFHPFVLYGFIYLLCNYLLRFCKEIQSEGEDPLKDPNLCIIERIAIASCRSSLVGSAVHRDSLDKTKKEKEKIQKISHFNRSEELENLDVPLLIEANVNLPSNIIPENQKAISER